MKVYNQDKSQILDNYDLDNGYLVKDKIVTVHHDEQLEVKEVSHIEIIKEYENGGKDGQVVIDVPYQPYRQAYDEYEDILVYIEYSEEEKAQRRIDQLKELLKDNDYKTLKYIEGQLSAEEFARSNKQRELWRQEINRLEKLL